MKNSHHFFVTLKTSADRDEFLRIGVDLPNGALCSDGELVHIQISEDHPQWDAFLEIMKKRVLESSRSSDNVLHTGHNEWLDGYSGQTVDQLLSLEGRYRTDSLVLAFEQAIGQKVARGRELSKPELVVLAVEALEREVNNGGYAQFLDNCPEFVGSIVDNLQQTGCSKTAAITKDAIKGGASGSPQELANYDQAYLESGELLADRLLDFIKKNKSHIHLRDTQAT